MNDRTLAPQIAAFVRIMDARIDKMVDLTPNASSLSDLRFSIM